MTKKQYYIANLTVIVFIILCFTVTLARTASFDLIAGMLTAICALCLALAIYSFGWRREKRAGKKLLVVSYMLVYVCFYAATRDIPPWFEFAAGGLFTVLCLCKLLPWYTIFYVSILAGLIGMRIYGYEQEPFVYICSLFIALIVVTISTLFGYKILTALGGCADSDKNSDDS